MKGSRVWVILHQPLYHTYIHHDASGTGTWTSISSGNKFWVFAIPKRDTECTSLDALHAHNSRYMLSQDNRGKWLYAYPDESERFCIFGKRGDMMCVTRILFLFLFFDKWVRARVDFSHLMRGTRYTPQQNLLQSGGIITRTTPSIFRMLHAISTLSSPARRTSIIQAPSSQCPLCSCI